MRNSLSGDVTVMILRSGGRSPISFSVPKWFLSLVHSCALTLLCATGLFGWHLQGTYGLRGHSMAHLGIDAGAERWSLFEEVSPAFGHNRLTAEAVKLGVGDRRGVDADHRRRGSGLGRCS
jgi:hypothetical protein